MTYIVINDNCHPPKASADQPLIVLSFVGENYKEDKDE